MEPVIGHTKGETRGTVSLDDLRDFLNEPIENRGAHCCHLHRRDIGTYKSR